jgi:hypothetical protein
MQILEHEDGGGGLGGARPPARQGALVCQLLVPVGFFACRDDSNTVPVLDPANIPC